MANLSVPYYIGGLFGLNCLVRKVFRLQLSVTTNTFACKMALISTCNRMASTMVLKPNPLKMAAMKQSMMWSRVPASSMATMKTMSPAEHKISREEFFQKNERLERPLSPHLTIYKFQMTSILSITHRFTGLAQTGLLSGFAIASMTLPGTFPAYLSMLQEMHLGVPIIFMAKYIIAWPFAYHILNGVRHLAWDMGWGFKLPELYKTGYTVLGLSVVLAAALASI